MNSAHDAEHPNFKICLLKCALQARCTKVLQLIIKKFSFSCPGDFQKEDHKSQEKKEYGLKESDTIDDNILQALGPDPNKSFKTKLEIIPEITSRLTTWLDKGVGEANLDFLFQQYEMPKYLKVPELNPEITAYLEKNAKDRDRHLKDSQQLIAVAIASLMGQFIVYFDKEVTMEDETRNALISMTLDSTMVQAHAFFEATLTRRAFVIRSIKSQEVKQLLEKQKTDEFLFGKNLSSKLKELKAVEKAAQQLDDQRGKISAKSFLASRNAHPFRQNKPWAGQGSQRDRWSFNRSQQPFFVQQKPNQGYKNKRNINQQKK